MKKVDQLLKKYWSTRSKIFLVDGTSTHAEDARAFGRLEEGLGVVGLLDDGRGFVRQLDEGVRAVGQVGEAAGGVAHIEESRSIAKKNSINS